MESDLALHRVKAVLNGFKAAQHAPRAASHNYSKLLNGFRTQLQSVQQSQRYSACDFDLLDVLQVSQDEVRHSMLLAWLLDNRIEHAGTHAQGNLGFELFLREVGLSENYAKTHYLVSREVRGDESRVDVEVIAPSKFIIHLENKVYSKEGYEQTQREWRDLLKRAGQFAISRNRVHAFFVSINGMPPANDNFRPISWYRIAKVLDAFATLAKAPDVKLFAAHYARSLRRMGRQTPDIDENETNSDIE